MCVTQRNVTLTQTEISCRHNSESKIEGKACSVGKVFTVNIDTKYEEPP